MVGRHGAQGDVRKRAALEDGDTGPMRTPPQCRAATFPGQVLSEGVDLHRFTCQSAAALTYMVKIHPELKRSGRMHPGDEWSAKRGAPN